MSFEDLVLSDVHVETCPPGERLWTTTFTVEEDCNLSSCLAPFNAPRAEVDEDGDLVVPRRTPSNRLGFEVCVRHHLATPLRDVGLQVWRGALLLADYIMEDPTRFRGAVVLELGCGTGLAGIIASRFARRVFLTDKESSVLRLARDNVLLNQNVCRSSEALPRVRHLDWNPPWPWAGQNADSPALEVCSAEAHGRAPVNHESSSAIAGCAEEGGRLPAATQLIEGQAAGPSGDPEFEWTPEDLKDLASCSVVLGADVIYDEDATEALLNCAHSLLQFAGDVAAKDKALLLAVEKRWNFTLRDMEARAPAFHHLCSLINLQSTVGQAGDALFCHPSFSSSGQTAGATDPRPASSPKQIAVARRASETGVPGIAGPRGAGGRRDDVADFAPVTGAEAREGGCASRCDPGGAEGPRAVPGDSLRGGRSLEGALSLERAGEAGEKMKGVATPEMKGPCLDAEVLPRGRRKREAVKENQCKCRFVANRVDVDSVRRHLAYERGPDLELLELRLGV